MDVYNYNTMTEYGRNDYGRLMAHRVRDGAPTSPCVTRPVLPARFSSSNTKPRQLGTITKWVIM